MSIEIVIPSRPASIGAFDVRRVLPFRVRRSVGPFVFVDDFGPFEVVTDGSADVLAHPHIGLATVTYLFEGEMTHRDSLGTVQTIAPGEVNWMTAGRGIVHSERVSDAANPLHGMIRGLQTWVALPESAEDGPADFAHYHAGEIPVADEDKVSLKLILGSGFGLSSPVATMSNPLYAQCDLSAGRVLEWPNDVEERSAYVLAGSIITDGRSVARGEMAVFAAGSIVEIKAETDSTLMLIGGDRLEKPRYMWWNFVSSRQEHIEQARSDWRDGNFEMIPNETGFVPLPAGNFPKPQPL